MTPNDQPTAEAASLTEISFDELAAVGGGVLNHVVDIGGQVGLGCTGLYLFYRYCNRPFDHLGGDDD